MEKLSTKPSYKKTINLVEGYDKSYFESVFKSFDQEGNNIIDFR